MFHRSVSRIPSRPSWASFSCSSLARCLCHSRGKRSYVAGFKSPSGRKSREDFSAAPATADFGGAVPAASDSGSAAAPTPDTVTAAPVAAINSRLLIIFPPLLMDEVIWGTLLTHFSSARKCGVKMETAAALWNQASRALETRNLVVLAAKMELCEQSRSIADCAAGGRGAAAGIYWVGAGGGE